MFSLAAEIRKKVGMVIPVWFQPETGSDAMRALLGRALMDTDLLVDPANVLLVVDGAPWAAAACRRANADREAAGLPPVEILDLPDNLGKGGAVAYGFRHMWERRSVELLSVRDDDGDHSIYDLPHLYAAARHAMRLEGTDLAVVGGRRFGLHRPLGFYRGEFELMVNQITWDALKFALARDGRSPNTRYLCAYDVVPDIQSGYKLYPLAAAHLFADAIECAHRDYPELDMRGWGVELVPAVETLLAGGTYVEVMRITYETQPGSTFQQSSRAREYAREATWVFKRLAIPPAAALQMLDNATPRSLLRTDPQGRMELAEARAFVAAALGLPADDGGEAGLPEFF